MIILPRTDDKRQLTAIYSSADVFFNPTREDNFPTVNLEAEACGTPVVTFQTGGCAETIGLNARSATVIDVDSAVTMFEAAAQGRPPHERLRYEL